MKNRTGKILFLDKPLLIVSFLILMSIIAIIMSLISSKGYEDKNRTLKMQLTEIQSLSGSVMQTRAAVQSIEKKLRLRRPEGVVSTLEQILKNLGLEAQVIKPLGKSKINEYTEENAELELKGADLNSIVNLLYKIDISPAPLKIKTAAMKSSFEDPDTFVFNLTVSLMSK